MNFINTNISKINSDCEYAIALGNFDGMHFGHRCVIDTAKIKAKHLNCKSAVFTFWPHPNKVLAQKNFNDILSLEEKIALIKEMGVDEVFVIEFTPDFSKTTAEEFVNHLCQQFKIKSITTGYNFRFGHNRHGNIETLHRLKKHYGFEFNTINQVLIDGSVVSSSVLRKFLEVGCVNLFSEFTGKKYTIDCNVSTHYNSEIFNIFKSINSKAIFACLKDYKEIILPTSGIYLVQIQQIYFCLFFANNKEIFLIPINNQEINLGDSCKIEFLQIIKQYTNLDKTLEAALLIDACIKEATQYLEFRKKS